MELKFDPTEHRYTYNDKYVPGVTTIISTVLPYAHNSMDWYLQRGSAMHQCAEYIAKGIDFDYDERLEGRVQAIRKFFKECQPQIIETESMVFNKTFMYAGTYDLLAKFQNKKCLFDYKSTFEPVRTGLQLGAYAFAMHHEHTINIGYGVEIRDDGSYRLSDPIKLSDETRRFLALRTVYSMREELKLN